MEQWRLHLFSGYQTYKNTNEGNIEGFTVNEQTKGQRDTECIIIIFFTHRTSRVKNATKLG